MKRQERMARYFERFARPEQTGMFARLEDQYKIGHRFKQQCTVAQHRSRFA